MFSRLFPRQIDNSYRGHWLGIVLFVVVLLLKGSQGLVSMVNPGEIMVSADGIPIDSFGAGAETAVRMFAMLGMYILILSVISAVTLIRWRALIPFMLVVLLAAQVGARVIGILHPMLQTASADDFAGHSYAYWINWGIVALTVIGLILSLINRSKPARLAQDAR